LWVKSTKKTQESLLLRRLLGIKSWTDQSVKLIKFDREGVLAKFRVDQRDQTASLKALLSGYKLRSLQPFIKEPVIGSHDSSFLKQISTANFESEIFSTDNTVILLIVAPTDYCETCSKFIDRFDYLSKTSGLKNTVFAVSDSFENEFDEFLEPHFPQLFVFSHPNKESAQALPLFDLSDINRAIQKLAVEQGHAFYTDL
jgi:hypothetical protein